MDQRAQRATQANGSEHRVKALARGRGPRVPSRPTVAKGSKQPAASQAAAYSGS
jgi:hypothetical protein